MKVRHVDYSPDEFLAGTAMLSDAECGLYWRACTLIYSTGGPVPIEHLRAVSGSHGNAFNRNLARLVSLKKLTRNGEEIDQKRAENELERARKRSEKASENGTKGNEIRWHKDRKPIAEPIAITNHQPSTKKESEDSNESSVVKPGGLTPPRQAAERMVEIWKAECGDVLPVPTKFTDARVRTCRLRLADDFGNDLERWRAFCQRVRGSPHLRGENQRGWHADFDWVLKPANLAKVEEGNYDDRPGAGANGRPKTPATQRFEDGMRVLADEVERRERARNCSADGEAQSDLRL